MKLDLPLHSAEPFVPETHSLPALQRASRKCRGCDLWKVGTQTVFGEGRAHSRLMLVGEQPGDEEDVSGHPFVGPSGRLLDRALEEAGIVRSDTYVTNAVKHFKWEPRGKRRIHKKPNTLEVRACRPWLEAEIDAVKPEVIVCLGSTAAQALLGSGFSVMAHRREWIDSPAAPRVGATLHPSAILRIRDSDERKRAFADYVDDFRYVGRALNGSGG